MAAVYSILQVFPSGASTRNAEEWLPVTLIFPDRGNVALTQTLMCTIAASSNLLIYIIK